MAPFKSQSPVWPKTQCQMVAFRPTMFVLVTSRCLAFSDADSEFDDKFIEFDCRLMANLGYSRLYRLYLYATVRLILF